MISYTVPFILSQHGYDDVGLHLFWSVEDIASYLMVVYIPVSFLTEKLVFFSIR